MANQTYSFRAPSSVAEQVKSASAFLAQNFGQSQEDVEKLLARELQLALIRRMRDFHDPVSASEFMRNCVEIVTESIERVESGFELIDQYRMWSEKDEEGTKFRKGALKAARLIWDEN